MFGHQNDVSSTSTDSQVVSPPSTGPTTNETVGGEGITVAPVQSGPASATDTPSALNEPTSAPTIDSSAGTSDTDSTATSTPIDTTIVASNEPTTAMTPSSDSPSVNLPDADDANGLLGLKQQALQQLSPLIDHLDQSAEEKFRTTMMMIQANDDQSLIKNAYAAAQEITDEKVRAQALLDVVNEINYFTQKKS